MSRLLGPFHGVTFQNHSRIVGSMLRPLRRIGCRGKEDFLVSLAKVQPADQTLIERHHYSARAQL